MNFLEAFVIPRSEQTLKLIEIFYFLSYSIFNLYFAALFGSILYSVILYFLAFKKQDINFLSTSFEYLQFFAKGYLSLIGLGFVPLLSVYYSLLQFILKAPSGFFQSLLFSTIFFVLSVLLLKLSASIFKTSKNLSKFQFELLIINSIAIIFILTVVVLTNATAFSIINSQFASLDLSIKNLFSLGFLLRLLAFLAMSIMISSLLYFYKTYTIDRVSTEDNSPPNNRFTQSLLTNFIIVGNLFPIIVVAIFMFLPKNLVSLENYIFVVISLLVFLLSLLFGYLAMKSGSISYAKGAFLISIFSFLLFFVSESYLLAVSNKIQEFKIAKEFTLYHEKLLASAGRSVLQEINGEEIYKAKCVACHQFDAKLVGPPHKEVLKKYENRKEDMVKFILNPVRVDPNYPPMPNQGLKPNEAEAVVKYMFEHYGPMLK